MTRTSEQAGTRIRLSNPAVTRGRQFLPATWENNEPFVASPYPEKLDTRH
jgi:hypothetical protein